jgi:hypothetical protein
MCDAEAYTDFAGGTPILDENFVLSEDGKKLSLDSRLQDKATALRRLL